MMPHMKRANFYLPDELIAKLKQRSIATLAPMSALLRKFIAEGLRREERKAKAGIGTDYFGKGTSVR
jgi:hypothetical protein